VFIKALRDIEPGEELNYDYGLVIDSPLTPELKADYACWCGAPSCRGTMLASSMDDDKKSNKKKKKKDKKKGHKAKDKRREQRRKAKRADKG
jgi:hypothetical protein